MGEASRRLALRAAAFPPSVGATLVTATRLSTPLAVLLTLNNVRRAFQHLRGRPWRHVLFLALSAWSAAEALFLLYITWKRRELDRMPLGPMWRALHDSNGPERRRANVERHLRMVSQIFDGGGAGCATTSPLSNPEVRLLLRETSGRSLDNSEGTFPFRRRYSVPDCTALEPVPAAGSLLPRSRSSMSFSRELGAGLLDALQPKHDHEDEATEGHRRRRFKWHYLSLHFIGDGLDPSHLTLWLRRHHLEQWVASYFFRGATLEELSAKPAEWAEMQGLVDAIIEGMEVPSLPDGANPAVRPYLRSDPLQQWWQHQPLWVFVGPSVALPMLGRITLPQMGFKRHRIGSMFYWHRLPRADVAPSHDIAAGSSAPLVFLHGLGGLGVYLFFFQWLSQRCSSDIFLPAFPFLHIAPSESRPSVRETVAQLQDMLAANGHKCAHFASHSFGSLFLGWMLKRSPYSVASAAFLDPVVFQVTNILFQRKLILDWPATLPDHLLRYFIFRNPFVLDLIVRSTIPDVSGLLPDEVTVPAVVAVASKDAIVLPVLTWRVVEYERMRRKLLQRTGARSAQEKPGEARAVWQPLHLLWFEDFHHGQVLFSRSACHQVFHFMRKVARHAAEAGEAK
eukprot:NODE_120_length_2047_cov_235.329317.p1 GENE.NODE_120_length_2047_cov_235.329317~~NODE_120_length_2047_cov_235.329317.p1  ORF type:complete len:624 (+),score=171.69 NODE_120_length_2047_cov_235.329317:3-1874(+)